MAAKANKSDTEVDIKTRVDQLIENNNKLSKQVELLKKNIKAQDDKISKIEAKNIEINNELQEKIQVLTDRIKELEDTTKTNGMPANQIETRPTYASFFKSKTNEATLLRNLNREKSDQESKKSNIIITGLPYSEVNPNQETDDKEIFQELANHITCDLTNINHKLLRIGKINENGTRKLLVKLNEEKRKEFLEKAKKLRSSDRWNTIYINADLTRAQQEAEYFLRNELRQKKTQNPDKKWIISKGRVVETQTRPNSVEPVI